MSNKIERTPVQTTAHTHEALYLVELNRELRVELSGVRAEVGEVSADLLATTGENERMEEQLRYLRSLQKNLVAVDRQQDAIICDFTQLEDLSRKNALATSAAVKSGCGATCAVAVVLAVLYLSAASLEGYARLWLYALCTLLLAAAAARVVNLLGLGAKRRKRYRETRDEIRQRARRRKRELTDFRKSCDYVIELIESV